MKTIKRILALITLLIAAAAVVGLFYLNHLKTRAIPDYNEERSISSVIKDIPELVNEIIVVNNGSTDNCSFYRRSC